MSFQFSGSIIISGCAVKRITKNFFTLFSVGSKVWIKNKAKKGKLEYVVIKKVYRSLPENYMYAGIQHAISYIDTFNRVWMEEELIFEQEAINLANEYLKLENQKREQYAIKNCLPEPPCGQ